jgi:hypothetical protein
MSKDPYKAYDELARQWNGKEFSDADKSQLTEAIGLMNKLLGILNVSKDNGILLLSELILAALFEFGKPKQEFVNNRQKFIDWFIQHSDLIYDIYLHRTENEKLKNKNLNNLLKQIENITGMNVVVVSQDSGVELPDILKDTPAEKPPTKH